ncbi:MAG: peptidoglycan DD-metalloendopeptidase family protein [Azospirillum sp.]|nr:peptidoglycan DD-metalloendopeptidase family protein [Azospirillum sp.]
MLLHLASPDRRRCTLAFYALQFCWAPPAAETVRRFLAADDPDLRRMAAIVLVKGEGYGRFIDCCRSLLDDPRAEVAGFALDHVEAEHPDLERTRHGLCDPVRRRVLARHLPRYHHPSLIQGVRALLDGDDRSSWPGALAALIHLNADDGETRNRLIALLGGAADPRIRELAAEALTWHGGDSELPALSQAVRDPDAPTAAAAAAAVAAILRRRATAGADHPVSAAEREHYRSAEAFEPHWAYRGSDPPADFVAGREARLALQARIFAVPGDNLAMPVPAGRPAAALLVAPVRDFGGADDKSYGREVEDSAVKGFCGLIHVGRDVAWQRSHEGVVAIAAGMVRRVVRVATWGGLVVIEHRDPQGRGFCSLYGHLSPFVCVRPGELVSAGQKIGAVGRAFTWENGGYDAHLHFAIHDGGYSQPPRVGAVIDLRYRGRRRRATVVAADAAVTHAVVWTERGREPVHLATDWVCGYISGDWFDAGDHGWQDPWEFLARRGAL